MNPTTTPQIQKVVFRASRRKHPEITAVLIGQVHSRDNPLTVWDSQSGHGGGCYEWYYSTRPALPSEYSEELKKLRRQYAPEYKIQVMQRIPSVRNAPTPTTEIQPLSDFAQREGIGE